MTEKLLWKGKGPVMYEVRIYNSDDFGGKPSRDTIENSGWKYSLYLSGAGDYADAYLGNDTEEIGCFADTKAGVIRDMAILIYAQDKDPKFRAEMGWPPEPIDLNNVEIYDITNNHEFHDLDIPFIFSNAKRLSDTAPPSGERPFLAEIQENEESPGAYDLFIDTQDPVIIEQFENRYAYSHDLDDYHENVPAKDVIKAIKSSLSWRSFEENGRTFTPNINNTKLINFSDNTEFSLEKIFTKPPQLTRMPITKTQQSHARASLPISKKWPRVILPVKIEESEPEKEAEEEKRRLRA